MLEEEKRDQNIKVRLSKSERETVEEYCEKYGMNLSIFVRNAIVTEMRRLDGKSVDEVEYYTDLNKEKVGN